MKRFLTAMAAAVAAFIVTSRVHAASGKAEWHFPVHVGYVSGISDVMDTILEGGGADEKFEWPVGLAFQPYVAFPSGFGVGLDVGPFVMVGVEFDGDDDWDEDEINTILPLGAYVRYDFQPAAATNTYVRLGVRKCFTDGPVLDDGSLGLNGALGVEFMRDRRFSWGLEAGYDTSEVEVWQIFRGRDDAVKPIGFMASVFVDF